MNMRRNTVASSKATQAEALLSGFSKHLGNQKSLMLGNATYTAAAVTKALQAFVDAYQALIAEKAKEQTTHQAAVAAEASATPLVKLIVAYVRAVYGNNTEVLTDFGLQPHKVAAKKPPVLVQASVKAKATRAARHTMGKAQKKGVTGQTVQPPRRCWHRRRAKASSLNNKKRERPRDRKRGRSLFALKKTRWATPG
jgi:hypothetical protein